MKKIWLILAVLLIGILVFTRFYNLDATTRFTRDEASNLIDMHRIWKEKDITFIGPVDINNTVIYPSLTYYMLLPFAAIGNFSPASPAYGTAFFGALTAILLVFLTHKVNRKFTVYAILIGLFWYPLVESSRWAWNPHLVPFMSVLALIFWARKGNISKFISGIFFGLSFHLHYFSIVSFAVFGSTWGLIQFSKKKFKEVFLLALGFISMLVPFVIFDIKNPPGLFFGKYLNNNLVSTGFATKLTGFWSDFTANLFRTLFYITQNNYLAIIVGVLIVILLIVDIKKHKENLLYFLPVITQVACISFLPYWAGRYFLLASPFFIFWLITKREFFGSLVSKFLILVMVLGSIIAMPKLLSESQVPPGGAVVEKISNYIVSAMDSEGLKNVNIVVLESSDPDPLGVIYRHTLLVKEKRILLDPEYNITDNLFVVTQGSEESVRGDESNIINGFRSGKAELRYQVAGTDWKLYLFNRDKKK